MTLCVRDLAQQDSVKEAELSIIAGGNTAAQGIGNGGVTGNLGVATPGFLFASPVTAVSVVAPVTTNIQVATVLELVNQIDTTNIIGSLVTQVEGLV